MLYRIDLLANNRAMERMEAGSNDVTANRQRDSREKGPSKNKALERLYEIECANSYK